MAGVEDARRSPPRHGTRFANPRTAESESQLAARDAGAAPLKSAAISGVVAWVAAVVGCGARTGLSFSEVARDEGAPVNDGQGSDEGGSSSEASSSEAAVTSEDTGAVAPGVTCSLGASGVAGGGGSCEVQSTETCSDGATYHVVCSCPAARCTCSESSGQSGSPGGGMPFSGCAASCSSPLFDLAYESCGFPH